MRSYNNKPEKKSATNVADSQYLAGANEKTKIC